MALEITWTVIPFLILNGLFVWSTWIYADYLNEPEHGVEIDIVGKQWMWKFRHPGGQREINTLHVPLGQPVQVTLGSQDVIHSFFVPAFRVKQDAVPGFVNENWVRINEPGIYRGQCAELCGKDARGGSSSQFGPSKDSIFA